VALGWITMTVVGASYQLIPVVLERPLWSERLARWQFALLTGGVVGMVAHFYIGEWTGLVWAAGVVAAALALHVWNVALTVRGLARWTFTARLVALGHAGLAATLLFGLALATARATGGWPGDALTAAHAHFHLALLGWVVPMVMGVAARVYPMFLVAPEPAGRLGALQLAGLAAGIPLVVGGLLAMPRLVWPGTLAVAVALAAHAAWVVRLARERRRPRLDWGLRFLLTGTVFLAPAGAAGLGLASGALAGPRAALTYATLTLGGWVSLTMVGMLLKIVPFLLWQRAYAPMVGRAPVPTLAQLAWPAGERLAYLGLTAGTAGLAAAVATGSVGGIRTAGSVLAVGAAAFAASLARVVARAAAGARRLPAAGPAPARVP
jgi:hypothetical protein